ncbi:MAG: dTMP kinase [Dongiaceae bacterium]
MSARGRFIVLEGVDGSGKTTVLADLAAALDAAGRAPLVTREPGGTEEGLALRRLLLARDGHRWTPMAELLLINAARAQHVEAVIAPALAAGRVVLCDRFVGSTLAYQGGGRGLPADTVLALHGIATGDLWPDLTILLDLEPERAVARSRRRLAASGSDEGRFEALDIDFHRRVRQSFLDQAAARPATHAVIDADRPLEAVLADARRALADNLR